MFADSSAGTPEVEECLSEELPSKKLPRVIPLSATGSFLGEDGENEGPGINAIPETNSKKNSFVEHSPRGLLAIPGKENIAIPAPSRLGSMLQQSVLKKRIPLKDIKNTVLSTLKKQQVEQVNSQKSLLPLAPAVRSPFAYDSAMVSPILKSGSRMSADSLQVEEVSDISHISYSNEPHGARDL